MFLALDSKIYFSSNIHFENGRQQPFQQPFWYQCISLTKKSTFVNEIIQIKTIILGNFNTVRINNDLLDENKYILIIDCIDGTYEMIFEKNDSKFETPTQQRFLESIYERFVVRTYNN